jgi:hypothetical protein
MHPTHPGRRPWPTVLLLVVTALLLALFAVVLVAPPVGAHPLGGVQSSNYQARVLAVRPPVPGLTVEVVDAGSRLRLVNTGPRDVVVLGYQLEPWLRVGPRGVFENSRSPTLQMAGPRRADSPPPAAVDPGAPTSWRQVDAGQSVAWHDHRAHWEADEPPTQVRRAPGSTHVVIPRWTVKLRSGGRLVDVVGEVRWVPGPSPLPWLAGAALLAMAVVAVGRTRRWSDALAAALALVVALDLVQAAGAWTAAQAPLAGKLLSIGASAAGWVLAGLAIRQLLRRRVESGLFQLLLAAGLLTVVGGLGDLGYLLRSQLATTLPTWVVRAAVTAKIGLGLGALTAAALRLQRTLTPRGRGPPRPGLDLGRGREGRGQPRTNGPRVGGRRGQPCARHPRLGRGCGQPCALDPRVGPGGCHGGGPGGCPRGGWGDPGHGAALAGRPAGRQLRRSR